MVLENASGGASDSLSDDKPQSDGDQYDNQDSNDVPHVVVDLDKLPRRFTVRRLFTTTTNSTDRFLGKIITDRVNHMANILQRAPSQEEVDAMAFWTSKQLTIQSYALPIGVAAGSMRAYNSRSTFSFPFYKPNLEKLNTSAFPSSRFALLSGTLARQAWHCSRWVAYVTAGNIVAGFFTGGYAMSVTAVGEMADPRLKSYVEKLRSRAQQRAGRIPQPKQSGAKDNVPRNDDSPSWKDTDNDANSTDGSQLDMGTENVSGNATGAGQYGRIDDRTSMEGIAREARESPQSKNNNGNTGLPMENDSRDFYQSFDDASPTGGQGVADTSTQNTGGSAWDRIRQQAITGRSPRPVGSGPSARNPTAAQNQAVDEPTSADSYSFSSADQHRQTARDEAQKEFDARVERERRGGDFSTGNGDQKRW